MTGRKAFITKLLVVGVVLAVELTLVATNSAFASEPFGINTFETTITNVEGMPETQGGSHPYAMTTTIGFDTHSPLQFEMEEGLDPAPNGLAKGVEVNLPKGLIVNPTATAWKCTEAELDTNFECPNASTVGIAKIDLAIDNGTASGNVPVFNMAPPPGIPAEFGFEIAGIVVHIVGSTRTGGDYGLTAKASDILEKGALYGTALTLWGDPTAESHDAERGSCVKAGGNCPVGRLHQALLTLPSACTGDPLLATMSADSWEEPARFVPATTELPAVTGCGELPFAPTLSVHPSSPAALAAESPTGLEVDLKVPQEEGLETLATSDLKEAVVRLPAGMTVSASAANGLSTCGEAQIELTGPKAPTCPNASKLGTVEVVTPLLERRLNGSVYLRSRAIWRATDRTRSAHCSRSTS